MLINCVAYQDGKKLADIEVDHISDHISRDDTFVWVALQDATPAELEEMQQEFGLHELAVEDAHRIADPAERESAKRLRHWFREEFINAARD